MVGHNSQMLHKCGPKVRCLHNGVFYRVKVMEVSSGGIVQVRYSTDHSFEEVDVGRLSLKTPAATAANTIVAASSTAIIAPPVYTTTDGGVKEKVTRLEQAQN